MRQSKRGGVAADIDFLVTQKSENTLGSNDGRRDVLMMFSNLLKLHDIVRAKKAVENVCLARLVFKHGALKSSSSAVPPAFGGMLFYFADLIIRRLGYDFKRVCGVADGRTGGYRRRGE